MFETRTVNWPLPSTVIIPLESIVDADVVVFFPRE
jgi:hypothetical protein